MPSLNFAPQFADAGDSICDNCGWTLWDCKCDDDDFDLDEGTPAPGSYDGWQDDW